MLILLGRFSEDESTEPVITKKNTNPVELTPRLSIDMPVSTSLPPKQCDIRSIIHHIGSTLHVGHYRTDALCNNQWVSFSDDTTVEKNYHDVIHLNRNQKTAYMLMYKESDSDSHVVSKRLRRYIEYDRHESLVILMLTMWRTACLLNHPRKFLNSPSNLISYVLRDGWKENKVATRRDPMIGIVVTNVLPFLDM